MSATAADPATAQDWYSTPQLCRLTGLTFRQVDHWARCGYITPSHEAAGSGSRRRWDGRNVAICRTLAALQTRRPDEQSTPPWLLHAVLDNWDAGRVLLGPGVELIWTVPDTTQPHGRVDGAPSRVVPW